MAALSTALVRRASLGDLKATLGTFTATAGDAAGTITVEGGWAMAFFFSRDASGSVQAIPMRYSLSTSGNITTVTVYTQETVTLGDFIILHK